MKLKSFRNILSGLFLLCIVILAIVEKSGSHIATRSSPVATIAARNSSIKPVDITVFETIRIANSTTGNGNSSVQVQSKLPSPTVVAATEILPSNVSIKPVDIKAFQALQQNRTVESGGVRKSKNLLDWIGFGSGSDDDPYLASVNGACFEGVLSECLKYRALSSLDYFFDRDVFTLNDNVKVVRMPAHHLKQLKQETFEFSTSPRADEPEWDRFVKFLKRRVEFFVKSTAIEVQFPNEVTNEGRYAPRFMDEIATEIDIIEDKNESTFSRTRLKKLFIPLLIILKLFKLKLLLFLPLFLGLASFKKLLGFLALVVPGLIGFFKLCKPDLHQNYGSYGHSSFYQPPHHKHQYSPAGIATGIHYLRRESEEQPLSFKDQSYISSDISSSSSAAYQNRPNVNSYYSQQLAYKGYRKYEKR